MQRPLIDVHHSLSRREFLRGAAGAGLAGAVLLGACGSDEEKASPTSTPGIVVDPPPETTTIRLLKFDPAGSLCVAPLYLAEQLLPAEGFTNIQYIDEIPGSQQLAAGEIDIGLDFAAPLMAEVDRGDQLVALAGVHNSCFELFASDRVQSLRDLKGKRIFVFKADATDGVYLFMAALLAYVGIDLKNEVEFVELSNQADIEQAWTAGAIDTLLVPVTFSAAVRASNIGHEVLNGMMDAPWSQYFCCMATANRDFAEQHPAATKRALRAILKAADVCAREPERTARYLVDKGYPNYDEALDTMTQLSYTVWREFDPEDTLRFFALRLKEAGLVKSTPDELIARATDWRYLDEIKRELVV